MVSLVASFGSLTATVPYSSWISLAGWRSPFLTIGIILVLTALLLYIVLVKRPKDMYIDESKKEKTSKGRESVWGILKRTFSTRQGWATFLCHFGVVGAYVGFIGSWGVPYGIEVFGLSRSAASQLRHNGY